jgi:hypothetical protein
LLKALGPSGPSVRVKMRQAFALNSTLGILAQNINIGNTLVTLTDFPNFQNVFGRFTVVHAKFTVVPHSGFVLPAPTYRGALALGYVND